VPVCDPPDCNDRDLCTDDVCDEFAGCTHTPRVGFDAVTCRLDTISNTIAVTPAGEVGGAQLQRRFQARIAKAHRLVELARRKTGHDLVARLKRSGKVIASFIQSIQRGVERGKIPPAVGQNLIALATSAQSALLPLTP
jgi:hypothetical protein